MPTVIVSACGTSLLTNQTDPVLRDILIKTANSQPSELTQEQKEIIDEHLIKRQKEIDNADLNTIKRLSAELNGIITYYKGSPQGEQHIVLGTDTYLGTNTANMVAQWLQKQGLKAIPKVVKNLSTKNVESFRIAISEIVRWCAEELEKQYPRPHWTVVFNLTGGFKSVNGFLQALAIFYADESIYIFESGSQLIRIPRLPLQLDPEGVIGKHLQTFRRMGILKNELKIEECQGIPETLLEQIDDHVILSEWGTLIWQKCWNQYYSKELLPPLSEKLKYSKRFQEESKNLSTDRLIIINQRLDDLSQYLDSKGSHNPRSLDFKALKGRPFKGKSSPEITHECDAWSDQDAKRLYGYFEETNYVIDLLGLHL